MLKIKPPEYKYCPFCGKPLQIRIEEGKERKYCPDDKWTYYPRVTQSAVAVIEKDEKVLLVKRLREPYKGTWMFPAGYVSFGEHPEECVVREVKEETGLDVERFELLAVEQSVDDYREPGHLIFFYKVETKEGKITVENDAEENSDIDWFPISNPPEIGWINHKNMMEKLQKS